MRFLTIRVIFVAINPILKRQPLSNFTTQKPVFLTTVVAMLVVTAVLDILSTLSAIDGAGGWDAEVNPVFCLLRGSTSNHAVLIVLIRLVLTTLVILYFIATVKRTAELYPTSRKRRNLFGFLNYLFLGRDVSVLQSIYLIPPAKRFLVGLAVPMAFGLISTSIAVSVTNTFGLLNSTTDVVVCFVSTGLLGFFVGAAFLQREYHQSLSQHAENSS